MTALEGSRSVPSHNNVDSQLKAMAEAGPQGQWMAVGRGKLANVGYGRSLIEALKGWLKLGNRMSPDAVEFEFIRFLAKNAAEGAFKESHLALIDKAAKQVGLIKGDPASESQHTELNQLIDKLANQILQEKVLDGDKYKSFAVDFYQKRREVLQPLVAAPSSKQDLISYLFPAKAIDELQDATGKSLESFADDTWKRVKKIAQLERTQKIAWVSFLGMIALHVLKDQYTRYVMTPPLETNAAATAVTPCGNTMLAKRTFSHILDEQCLNPYHNTSVPPTYPVPPEKNVLEQPIAFVEMAEQPVPAGAPKPAAEPATAELKLSNPGKDEPAPVISEKWPDARLPTHQKKWKKPKETEKTEPPQLTQQPTLKENLTLPTAPRSPEQCAFKEGPTQTKNPFLAAAESAEAKPKVVDQKSSNSTIWAMVTGVTAFVVGTGVFCWKRKPTAPTSDVSTTLSATTKTETSGHTAPATDAGRGPSTPATARTSVSSTPKTGGRSGRKGGRRRDYEDDAALDSRVKEAALAAAATKATGSLSAAPPATPARGGLSLQPDPKTTPTSSSSQASTSPAAGSGRDEKNGGAAPMTPLKGLSAALQSPATPAAGAAGAAWTATPLRTPPALPSLASQRRLMDLLGNSSTSGRGSLSRLIAMGPPPPLVFDDDGVDPNAAAAGSGSAVADGKQVVSLRSIDWKGQESNFRNFLLILSENYGFMSLVQAGRQQYSKEIELWSFQPREISLFFLRQEEITGKVFKELEKGIKLISGSSLQDSKFVVLMVCELMLIAYNLLDSLEQLRAHYHNCNNVVKEIAKADEETFEDGVRAINNIYNPAKRIFDKVKGEYFDNMQSILSQIPTYKAPQDSDAKVADAKAASAAVFSPMKDSEVVASIKRGIKILSDVFTTEIEDVNPDVKVQQKEIADIMCCLRDIALTTKKQDFLGGTLVIQDIFFGGQYWLFERLKSKQAYLRPSMAFAGRNLSNARLKYLDGYLRCFPFETHYGIDCDGKLMPGNAQSLDFGQFTAYPQPKGKGDKCLLAIRLDSYQPADKGYGSILFVHDLVLACRERVENTENANFRNEDVPFALRQAFFQIHSQMDDVKENVNFFQSFGKEVSTYGIAYMNAFINTYFPEGSTPPGTVLPGLVSSFTNELKKYDNREYRSGNEVFLSREEIERYLMRHSRADSAAAPATAAAGADTPAAGAAPALTAPAAAAGGALL